MIISEFVIWVWGLNKMYMYKNIKVKNTSLLMIKLSDISNFYSDVFYDWKD